MKNAVYPLAVPPELLRDLRATAKETGLSVADAMRQSIKLGLPKLRQQLSTAQLKPLTKEECRECWGTADPEFDSLATHCASLPIPKVEE